MEIVPENRLYQFIDGLQEDEIRIVVDADINGNIRRVHVQKSPQLIEKNATFKLPFYFNVLELAKKGIVSGVGI